jgi:PIN domain nuclease of toxin-antitoxin system
VASIWEAAIKHRLGKLTFSVPFDTLLRLSEERGRFQVLPFDARHARATLDLPMLHGDPFDRMLLAQARADGLTLVTADEKIRVYGGESLWALA